jgi:hypothetical protein
MAYWDLQQMKELLEPSMEVKSQTPGFLQYYHIKEDRPESGSPYLSIVRSLWDGRVGVFSRCTMEEGSEGDYVTMSTIQDKADMRNEEFWINPHVSRWVRGVGLAISLDDWDMCCVGTFGKTAVWLEGVSIPTPTTTAQEIEKICFANFPPPQRPEPQLHTIAIVNSGLTQSEAEQKSSLVLTSEDEIADRVMQQVSTK